MEVEHVTVIEKPIADVWSAFDDPDQLVEWQERLKSYEQIEGASDEIGSVSLQTIRRSKGDLELTVTLLDRREGEFSQSRYEGMQLPFTISNTFTEIDDDTTEWHVVVDVRLNLMQKALAGVLKGPLTELAEQNGEDFKKFVESR